MDILSRIVNIYEQLQTGEDGNISSTVLSFRPEKEDDQKFLSCQARNQLLPDTAVEDQWKITVYCKSGDTTLSRPVKHFI